MGNDDRVLSQSEIDALLSNALVKGNAPAGKAAAPAAVTQAKVPEGPPKAGSVKVNLPPPPPPKVVATTASAAAATMAAAQPVMQPQAVAAAQPGQSPEQVAAICRQLIADQTRDLGKQVLELTIKINKLDSTKQRMEQIEAKIDELAEIAKSSPKAVRAMGARIDEIYGLLENVRQHSDEDHIHDEFQCVNCHSKKLVAIHVKCTSCGTENWMGWFPDSRKK